MQKQKSIRRMRQKFNSQLLKQLYHQVRPAFFIVKMKQVHAFWGAVGSIRQISNIVYYGSSLAGQLSWLERRNHNPQVGGSNPSPATIKFPLFTYLDASRYSIIFLSHAQFSLALNFPFEPILSLNFLFSSKCNIFSVIIF